MQDKIEKGSNLVAIYNMPNNSSLSKLSHENWKACGKRATIFCPHVPFHSDKGKEEKSLWLPWHKQQSITKESS